MLLGAKELITCNPEHLQLELCQHLNSSWTVSLRIEKGHDYQVWGQEFWTREISTLDLLTSSAFLHCACLHVCWIGPPFSITFWWKLRIVNGRKNRQQEQDTILISFFFFFNGGKEAYLFQTHHHRHGSAEVCSWRRTIFVPSSTKMTSPIQTRLYIE